LPFVPHHGECQGPVEQPCEETLLLLLLEKGSASKGSVSRWEAGGTAGGEAWHTSCAWECLKLLPQCRQLAKLFNIVNVLCEIADGLRWILRYAFRLHASTQLNGAPLKDIVDGAE